MDDCGGLPHGGQGGPTHDHSRPHRGRHDYRLILFRACSLLPRAERPHTTIMLHSRYDLMTEGARK